MFIYCYGFWVDFIENHIILYGKPVGMTQDDENLGTQTILMIWEPGNTGKQSILITWDPGNTGKQSILITWDPGNTGKKYPFNNLGSWKYWTTIHSNNL